MRIAATLAGLSLALGWCGAAASASPLPGAKDRNAWRALLHWPAACERDWQAIPEVTSGISVLATGGHSHLVLVDCDLGAYQGNSMLYLVSPSSEPTGPLALRIYADPGSGKPVVRRQTVILGVISFDRKTGLLSVLDKFRGVGDCGIYSTFRLAGAGFVPAVARAKTACDGKPPYDPARWPRLAMPGSG